MSNAGGCVTGTLGREPPQLLLLALLLLQLLGASRLPVAPHYPVRSFTWDPTRLPQPTCRQGYVGYVYAGRPCLTGYVAPVALVIYHSRTLRRCPLPGGSLWRMSMRTGQVRA